MKRLIFGRQIMEAHMKGFENGFNALATLQDQWDRVTNASLDQVEWFPEELKKSIQDWIKLCRKGREDYRQAVEDSYKSLLDSVTEFEEKRMS